MFNRTIISFILVIYSVFHSTDSFAQQSFEIKAGLTYMDNKQDYADQKGYNLGLAYYPLSFSNFNVGVGVGYNAKGYFPNYLPYEYINFERRHESPVEFLELSIPLKSNFKLKDINAYILLAGRYDIILSSIDKFFRPIAEFITFSSTLGLSAGFGIQYTKIHPNLLFEFTVNPDLTYFIRNRIKNTSFEFKTGIKFDGFSSKKKFFK